MRRIYFDNAATTPIDDRVLEVMHQTLRDTFGNPSSIHAEGRAARAAIEQARKTIAHSIGASTGEIFFTSGGTESNNMALKGAVRDLRVQKIISSPIEHHCGLHSFETISRDFGTEICLLPVQKNGHIDLQLLENELIASKDKKTLVSLMHGNNEIGSLLDLDAVSQLCQQYGALFHSDTVQTVGHFPINLTRTKVHFLSGSAHKFHGPKGVGFIYINSAIQLKPYIDGGSQERNMRGGTENVASIVGMARALELAVEALPSRRTHILEVKSYLKSQLLENFEGIEFNGDPDGASLYHVLSVAFPPSLKNELLLLNLDICGFACSGGSACASGTEKASHVLEAIGAAADRKSIRFSFSHHNSVEEVDFLIEKLKIILK